MRQTSGLILLIAAFVLAPPVRADEAVDYLRDVKTILSRRCISCHGTLKQKNGLRLDTAAAMRTGGSGGAAIEPGKSDESLLIDAVTAANGAWRMPPEGEPLSPEQIATLRKWIDQGAVAPDEKPPQDPARHWSYQLPVQAAVPVPRAAGRVRNAIDAFLLEAQEQHKLPPVAEAPPHVLLRRVYLDLIGLPPTRQEMAAFLADPAPDAYERVVDRLLASPRFGERWGRHWMDVWRYSDWDGYGAEVRESKPFIWRWRDWIIESINDDRPYNRMVMEMLAGDELAPEDQSTLRATGFLVRNWFSFNRNVWLDATVEHTGKAFLGTTFNCARCHDHMYDPISQQNYYQLRAFFETHNIRTDRVPSQPDLKKDGLPRAYEASLDTPTYLFRRGNDKEPDKDHPLFPGLPRVMAAADPTISPINLAPVTYYPGLSPMTRQAELAQSQSQLNEAKTKHASAVQSLAAARTELTKLIALAETRQVEQKEKPPQEKTLSDDPKGSDAKKGNAIGAVPPTAPQVFLIDNFAMARADVWKTGLGRWDYQTGKLVQSEARPNICQIVSTESHPLDFSASFRFKITGGVTWKSVGLSFDVTDESNFQGVYLSANAPGPKVQIWQRHAGQDLYPAAGAKPLVVETGRVYELQVAVRDQLVNVSIDGQLQLVYRLPEARAKAGKLALWTYDATAEFLAVSISTLPAGVPLVERVADEKGAVPATAKPVAMTPQVAQANAVKLLELKLALAEKRIAMATAAQTTTQARIDADRARYATPADAKAHELATAAEKLERELAVLKKESDLLAARQKAEEARQKLKPNDNATKKQADAATAMIATSEKALADARLAVTQPATGKYAPFGEVYPATSTGRRLALAQWIASRDNPLTARVAVNHLWMRHFGSPLVSTVFDFGLNGKPPTHPALLDWLAVELMESGWKMKAIHRLIVTSDAYRRQSHAPADHPNRQADPDNVFLWRMNPRRMEAEAVRDSTLHVAGRLDLQMYGPDLDPNTGMQVLRRTVYFRSSKEKKMTFVSLFDGPNVTDCYRRSESIAPQQALAMANSALTLAQLRVIATQLSAEVGRADNPATSSAFVQAAFDQILSRLPTEAERVECLRFLAGQTGHLSRVGGLTAFVDNGEKVGPPAVEAWLRARENFVLVLLNHHDFLTIR